MLRVMVDRDRDERGDIETTVCRMEAGPRPRCLIEAVEEGERPRPGVGEPSEEVGERVSSRRARDRAPSTTNGARSRRGSRSNARTTRRARRRSSGEPPRWHPIRPGGCGRPAAARAGTTSRAGKSENDRTSAARLVTRPMSVLDPREASRTLLLLVESMGVTRRLQRHPPHGPAGRHLLAVLASAATPDRVLDRGGFAAPGVSTVKTSHVAPQSSTNQDTTAEEISVVLR